MVCSTFESGVARTPIVSITFDDGNISQISEFYPILKRYGFAATFYVVAGQIGLPGKLSMDDLHRLFREGNEIGSHGMTHRSLLRIPAIQATVELEKSRDILKRFDTRAFSYPFGHYDMKVCSQARCYYESARGFSSHVSVNSIECLEKYALRSFPVDGTFQSRIDPERPEYLLSSRETVESHGWLILTLHGRTSISRRHLSSLLRRANLTREQMHAYARDIRGRLSVRHSSVLRNFDRFCSDLVHEKIVVKTVSRALEEL